MGREARGRLEAAGYHLVGMEDGRLRTRDPDGAILYITLLDDDNTAGPQSWLHLRNSWERNFCMISCWLLSWGYTLHKEPEPAEVLAPGTGSSLDEKEQILNAIYSLRFFQRWLKPI